MSDIDFAVWAPDEATFWASWVTAGIVTAPYAFTAEYPGIIVSSQTDQGWVPTRVTGTGDDGQPIFAPVSGWHANVRVTGPLVAEMTHGIDQHDAEGNPKNVFDRTWATLIFSLVWRDEDSDTRFPSGYVRQDTDTGAVLVRYADPASFRSPTNTWL